MKRHTFGMTVGTLRGVSDMYGVPGDLDLGRFEGATLIQVCLGEFYLQFRFQPAAGADTPGDLEIGVGGRWELRDSSGALLDHAMANGQREVYRVHVPLGLQVAGTHVDAPDSFALRFADGSELRVFDDSKDHESFSIQPGDVFV